MSWKSSTTIERIKYKIEGVEEAIIKTENKIKQMKAEGNRFDGLESQLVTHNNTLLKLQKELKTNTEV